VPWHIWWEIQQEEPFCSSQKRPHTLSCWIGAVGLWEQEIPALTSSPLTRVYSMEAQHLAEGEYFRQSVVCKCVVMF
jgi:hypothetical protein